MYVALVTRPKELLQLGQEVYTFENDKYELYSTLVGFFV